MACLVCKRGKVYKKEQDEEITYWCDSCGVQIEYCHHCGAEAEERRDSEGYLILDCVDGCGEKHYLELPQQMGQDSLAYLGVMMKVPPRR